MSAPDQTLECVVTRYHPGVSDVAAIEPRVSSIARTERTSYWVQRGYLFLGNSAASGPVDRLYERALAGQGWSAQSGTPPVFLDGHWGGRNYPAIRVEASELLRVLAGVEVTT